MLRTKTSRWTALTALVCLVVVAMSWFLLVSPRRGEAAEVRQEAEAARLQNDTMQTKIAQLKAQYAQLPARRAELREVYAQMPAAAAVPELIRSVTQLATASGMELKSITPQAAVQIDAKGAGAQAGASPSTAPTGGEGGTPAASPGASPATGGMRIVAVPIAISADGDYFQAVLFVKKVQTELPRAFLIDRLDINVLDHPVTASSPAPSASASARSSSQVTVTLTGKVYSLPDVTADAVNPQASPGAVQPAPSGPAPAPTAPAPSTPAPTGPAAPTPATNALAPTGAPTRVAEES